MTDIKTVEKNFREFAAKTWPENKRFQNDDGSCQQNLVKKPHWMQEEERTNDDYLPYCGSP